MARSVLFSDGGRLVFEDGTPVPLSAFGPAGAEGDGAFVASTEVLAVDVIAKAAHTALDPAVATTLYLVDSGEIYLGDTLLAETN